MSGFEDLGIGRVMVQGFRSFDSRDHLDPQSRYNNGAEPINMLLFYIHGSFRK